MNKLYRTLFLGAFIPSAILLIYYLTRFYFAYFIMSGVYFGISIVVVFHRPILNKSIRYWTMLKRVAELGMIVSFVLRSTYNSELFTVGMFACICTFLDKLPTLLQTNIEKPAVYVTLMMLFLSQASIVAQVAGACSCFLVIYEPVTKQIDVSSPESIEVSLKNHFNVKLLQVYMFFIIEWTLTRLNEWALLFILTGSVVFNAYAYMALDRGVPDIQSYASVNSLPPAYPIPLNVNEACRHCPSAKEVFKDHNL
jgi:hypothetical protein